MKNPATGNRTYVKKASIPKAFIDSLGNKFVSFSRYATEQELFKDPKLKPDERFVHAGLLDVFDSMRLRLGHTLIITSGRRSQEAQEYLREKDKRAAVTSPHVFGVALDIVVPGYLTDSDFAEMFRQTSKKKLGMVVRCGYVAYRAVGAKSSVWLHIDVAPLIWCEGLPESWKREGIVW